MIRLQSPTRARTLVQAVVTACFLFCGAAIPQAQSSGKIVVGYSAFQAPVAPLWIAQEQGFFAKYGLDPKLVFVRTTSVHIAGLLAGHIDVSYGGGSGVLSVAARVS